MIVKEKQQRVGGSDDEQIDYGTWQHTLNKAQPSHHGHLENSGSIIVGYAICKLPRRPTRGTGSKMESTNAGPCFRNSNTVVMFI